VRRCRAARYGLAGAVLAAVVTAAPAMAAPAPGSQAGPAAHTPSMAWGHDPVVSAFIKETGAAAIRNQDALSVFQAWIIRQPGFARSGWVGSIYHLAHKAMTVMWYGSRTPLLAAIIAEGQRRGIAVTVQHRNYSLHQLGAAAAAIWRQAAQGKWAGFHVSAIATVAAADTGITVSGTYTAVPVARRAPLVRSLATVVDGVPVRLVPGQPFTLDSLGGRGGAVGRPHSNAARISRHNDFIPFSGGGVMRRISTGEPAPTDSP
jgi:hypothetical protein